MPAKRVKKKRDPDAPMIMCRWETEPSPYYTEMHERWREKCRNFADEEVVPYIDKWSKDGAVAKDFYRRAYEAGVYASFYPAYYGGTPFEPTKEEVENKDINKAIENIDVFKIIIMYEELCRAGSAGMMSSWIHYLGVNPVLRFGSEKLRDLMRPCIRGEKHISLAISEPEAGSDVQNIVTTAKLNEAGTHFIVNGSKYWITGGIRADYFVTAVRTGGKGIFGISLLLIPRSEGVFTSRLPLQGHDVSDTAYVVFKDVKVPKENIIGAVNQGFMPIVSNFNGERFGIIIYAIGLARTCIEESAKYARSRETFGRALIDHQVIRHKIANMSKRVMSVHSWMELCAYQLMQDPAGGGLGNAKLVSDISLLKVEATQTLEYCAREARQIFGGRSYVRGGRAAKIERIYRDVSALAIYGGSEEIMLDLATRQCKL
jgi:alkylation response protein AidB-like acyl-CoA dehydrogenase